MPIHTPEFDGTTEADWNAPDLEDFGEDPDLADVDDHFVGSRSEFPPETFEELAWPVVEPNGDLNLSALQNAATRISQTEGFSGEEKDEARNVVESLAEDNFPDADFKSMTKETGEHEEDQNQEERDAPAVQTADHTEDIKTYFQKRKEENDGYEERAFFHDNIDRDDENRAIIEGTGAVTETRQQVGPFLEVIAEGAFQKTIQESDVRGLFNHDPNMIIGRTSAGTLELEERDEGLFFSNKLGNTELDHFIANRVQRGDITGASIGFQVMREEFEEGPEDKQIRRIKELKLFDVGPVTFPAFPQTDIGASELNSQKSKVLRADQKVGFDFSELTEIILRSENGVLCDLQDAAKLKGYISALKNLRESVINKGEQDEEQEKRSSGIDELKRQQEITKTQKQRLELFGS